MRLILFACLLLLALAAARADVDPALREDGILYFEDDLPAPIVGTVKSPTTLYLHRDFQMPLASFFAGQKIEIVGLGPAGYLVAGTYRNNSVSGWIRVEDLPPDVDPGLIAQAKKNQARREEIAGVIAKKQVIRGMTPDEVHQSLGDPDQTSSHTDDTGTSQTWTYTTYENVWQTSYAPGPYGQLVLQNFPVRTPVGRLIVTFTDGIVSAIEQHKKNAAGQGSDAMGDN